MTLLIAILIIVAFDMPGWLIPLSAIVWLCHLFYHYPDAAKSNFQTIVDNQDIIYKKIKLVKDKLDKLRGEND